MLISTNNLVHVKSLYFDKFIPGVVLFGFRKIAAKGELGCTDF